MERIKKFVVQSTIVIKKNRIPYILFFALLFFPFCVAGTFAYTFYFLYKSAIILRYLFCIVMIILSFQYLIRKDQIVLWLLVGILLVMLFYSTRINGIYMSAFVTYGLKAVFLLCYFVMAVHAYTEEMFSAVWWVCGLLTFVNILSILFFPEGLYIRYDLYTSGKGVAYWFLGNTNLYIDYLFPMIFCSLILQYLTNGNYRKFYISMALSILTVALVGSATTILVVAIIAAYFLLFRKGHIQKLANPILLSALYMAVSFVIVFLGKVEVFSFIIVNLFKKDLTLTSRTTIWKNVMDHIVKKPVFGYGFRNGNDFIDNSITMHAHNLFLHITYSGGIIALAVLLVLIVICIIRIYKIKGNKQAYTMFSLLWFAYLWMEFSEPRIYFPFFFAVIAVMWNAKKLIVRRKQIE